MSFAENLVREMDRAGCGVRDLAESVSVSQWTVYHWRNGYSAPHVDMVAEVACRLGCTCDDLIRGRA